MKKIKVFLVDNNKNFLTNAIRFLETNPMIEISGTATSGEESIEAIKQLKPDLVLMDVSMPGIGGLKTTKIIKEFENPPKVIILTLHDNPEYRAEAKLIGADNFLSKTEFGDDLFYVISELFFFELPSCLQVN